MPIGSIELSRSYRYLEALPTELGPVERPFLNADHVSCPYEGSYHIFDPAQIETAVGELLQLRKAYGGKRLRFNSIKVHYDGVVEVGTAGMLNPFFVGPNTRGGFLFTSERLAEFLLELDEHDIDLHLHSVGDAATREILDAAQIVRDQGKELRIELTISHLEHVDEKDVPRFSELGVRANFTPHWWGGTVFGAAGEMYVGAEEIHRSQAGGDPYNHGTNVTLSSDVSTMSNQRRANPFVGIQIAKTRQEYTIGSIEVGKRADFLVLPESLFVTDTYSIHRAKPDAVFLDGQLVAGSIR